MADLTPAAFQAKWNQRFADNDTFNIDEQDLREFTADQLRTFVARAEQLGKTLVELVFGEQVQAGQWYVHATGIFEARRTFTPQAVPVNGANWRPVLAVSSYGDEQAVAAVAASGLFNYYTDSMARAAVRSSSDYTRRVTLIPANPATPASHYIDYSLAENAASDGDTIYLSGLHEGLTITKSVVVAGPAVVRGTLAVSEVPYRYAALNVTVRGLRPLGRIVVVANDTLIGHNVRFESLQPGRSAFFEHYGLGAAGTGQDNIVVAGTRLRSTASVGGDVIGNGLLRFQERDDSPPSSRWEFEDCALESKNNPLFTGYAHPSTRVVLSGSTKLKYAGAAVQTVTRIGSGAAVADADILIDERVTTGGGGGPIGYRAAFDGSGRYSDAECFAPAVFAVQQLVNASGYTAQVIGIDGTAYGPQRTVAADVTTDIASAFATAPKPALVLVRVTPTRLDAGRIAYAYFTLS